MLQSTRQHGARLRPPGLRSSGPGFNPRARKGRDAGCAMDEALSDVFQSTRPHGARPWSVPAADAPVCFNPRARTGRDWAYPRPISAASSFNPRARTGRDHYVSFEWFPGMAFQSTRPHGARHTVSVQASACLRFQSTRPHGARPVALEVARAADGGFNPRARTGRDRIHVREVVACQVSIHAPARGATAAMAASLAAPLFQSTRPHGARLTQFFAKIIHLMFQSTRPHGARPSRARRRQ